MISPEAANPLDELLIQGKLLECDILSAFVFGSRAFGTASSTSDYDVYIVVRGENLKQLIFVTSYFLCAY
jgi:predicted nucleotidyltransferase